MTRDQIDGAHCKDCHDVDCPGDQAAGNALKRERVAKRELFRIKGHLRSLIRANRIGLAALDKAMTREESHERGQKIGRIATHLDMATDSADYTGLGRSWSAIRRDKKAAGR